MIYKSSKFVGVLLVLFIFLAGTIQVTYASVSMKELQARFYKETRKKWSKATSEERSNFMYKIRGREKKEEREDRVKGIVTPFYIREGYRKEFQADWEDATEEEQEDFIKGYKDLKKKWDREKKEKIREEKIRLMEIERAKRLEKRKLEKRRKDREKKARDKQKELEKKRKNEKKRLEDAKKKSSLLHKKLGDMHDSRTRD